MCILIFTFTQQASSYHHPLTGKREGAATRSRKKIECDAESELWSGCEWSEHGIRMLFCALASGKCGGEMWNVWRKGGRKYLHKNCHTQNSLLSHTESRHSHRIHVLALKHGNFFLLLHTQHSIFLVIVFHISEWFRNPARVAAGGKEASRRRRGNEKTSNFFFTFNHPFPISTSSLFKYDETIL